MEDQSALQSSFNICHPVQSCTPEPGEEPMQVENMRFAPAEQHCQLTHRLCLYCGASGNVIDSCPVRPPHPLVSYITCSKAISSLLTASFVSV